MAESIAARAFASHRPVLGQNYLIQGSDAHLIDKVLDQIKRALRRESEIDISIVYGDEIKAAFLAEHLDTFTIFSSSKLVIIRNTEAMLKKELEVLAAYFESPSEIQTLAIVTEKANKTLDTWKKIAANSYTVNCDPPRFASEMRTWLMEELRRMAKTMTPAAATEFTNRIELDYSTAANELAKIDLLVGSRKQITEKDLDSLGGSRAGTQIDFFRALGARQIKTALQAMDLMLESDWEPLQIHFSVFRFFVNLWKIQLLRARHITDIEISSSHIMDIYSTQRKEYLGFARNYSIKSLEKIMEILLSTDYKLKSSNIDKRLELDLSIIEILGQK
ncbi:MAG: DNA polymerase III subunit delta [Candidatus Cloacimonetes bacterium]|nr:DNA polymerase III subunit delta [Candidatus Cloacimonadota bacterium]MDY0230085.1 DNA polymerase III subunit delta [Candidatus Cloacimonadaceae bacterium]